MERTLSAPIEYTQWVQNGTEWDPVDREIKVGPITDVDLASLPHEQRVEKLRETRLTNATPFLEQQFQIPLEQVRPETLQLASFIHDVSSRDWETQHYTAISQKEEKAYETEKAAIRSGKRGMKARDKKVAILSQKWQQRKGELDSHVDAARKLKETTLDDLIKTTFLTPGGADSFLLSAQDLEEQSSISQDEAIKLLRFSEEHLKTMTDPEAIRSLRYKDGYGNLVVAKQASSLQQIIEVAIREKETELGQELKLTANQLIEFYWKNSRQIADPRDVSPNIALTYDLLLAATISKSLQLFYSTVGKVSDKVNENLDLFRDEFMKSREQLAKENLDLQMLVEYINQLDSLEKESGPRNELLEKLDPKKRGCVLGIYQDRLFGFIALTNLSKWMGKIDFIEEFSHRQSIYQRTKYINNGLTDPDLNTLAARIKEEFPETKDLAVAASLNMDKKTFIAFRRKSMYLDPLENRETRQAYVDSDFYEFSVNLLEAKHNPTTRLVAVSALQAIFLNLGIENYEDILKAESENLSLINRIKNYNLWFVAEQGDRFSASKNPDLTKQDIRAVTIYPAADYKGHQVSIETELRDRQGNTIGINVIIDANGEILWSDDSFPLEEPVWLSSAIKNFLLRRLHFITSGALGERGEHAKGEEENGRPTEVRRSHWRILTSKNGRVYTLNSSQAREHAEYVLETYGINIYEENLRRKQAGTLGKDQVLTFVKAVKGKAEPNQLVYDEEKLRQFEATLPSLV